MSKPANAFDIGVRCVKVDGRWDILSVLPDVGDNPSPELIGVFQDILASAIKFLAWKYLLKVEENPANPHSSVDTESQVNHQSPHHEAYRASKS